MKGFCGNVETFQIFISMKPALLSFVKSYGSLADNANLLFNTEKAHFTFLTV